MTEPHIWDDTGTSCTRCGATAYDYRVAGITECPGKGIYRPDDFSRADDWPRIWEAVEGTAKAR